MASASSFILFILQASACLFFCTIGAQANKTFSAIFSFGDSILDTGMNNNLLSGRCNYPPYGRDFPGKVATGRFCNGKNPTDLIAEALGIKDTVPAYLKPDLQNDDLLTGVGFASGGSGIDPLTSSTLGVVAMSQQLQYFKDYIGKLTGVAGEEKAKAIIANSLVLMSAGNNDIGVSYTAGMRKLEYTFPAYCAQLVTWSTTFLEQLYALGARRFGVLSTVAFGCEPSARLTGGSSCSMAANLGAQMYNNLLKAGIASLQSKHPDAKLVFFDIFTPLVNIASNPQQFDDFAGYHVDVKDQRLLKMVSVSLAVDKLKSFAKSNQDFIHTLTHRLESSSGYNPGVVAMSQQLQYFKDYIDKLTGVAGEEKVKAIIANSLVLMSAGNNDIGVSYTAGIASLQSKHPDAKLVFFDIFTPLVNIASNPQQFDDFVGYHVDVEDQRWCMLFELMEIKIFLESNGHEDSDQACKFFKWLDKNTCPRGRATAPLVHERFVRYKAEAVAVRNERDEAHAREAKAWELLRKAKRKGEKTNLKLRIAEDKNENCVCQRFAI
nr:gdsl esterase/lipase [Quercus suber]